MKNNFNILLVEDNPSDARLVEIYLSDSNGYNFNITKAESLKEAFEHSDINFDAILLDLSLPDSMGLETLQSVIDNFPNSPTIVLTGLDDETVGIQAVESGALDYLIKGDIDTRVLVKTISYAYIRYENESLLKAKEVAERTVELKQRFLANMSHELRTPLNVVIGMTDLLEKTEHTSEQEEYLISLKIASRNLLKVINDILDLSKIESNKIILENRRFSLEEFLQDLMKLYKYQTNQKGLHLYSQFDANLPDYLIGDSVRLNQVIINLMDNAIKYTENGEITLKAIILEKTDTEVLIEFGVKDTGIGIEKEKQDKIFGSFVQANESTTRLYGGTGLGLSIAKHLVGLFGGNMVVESEPGQGSYFKFTSRFKLDDSSYKAVEKVEVVKTLDLSEHEFNILLVEDHKLNQLVASKLVQQWSKNVKYEIANNGKEGFEKVRDGNFDLVLMDISMPIMDGLQATEKIRKELPNPKNKIPIIAMTAHALKSEVERCYEVGMNDFVSKPIDSGKLFEALNNQVQQIVSKVDVKLDKVNTNNTDKSVDISYLEELSGGDEELKIELVKSVLDDMPKELKKLKASFDLDKYDEYYKVAHKLKTTCAYIGLREKPIVIKTIIKPESGATFNFDKHELQDFLNLSENALQELKQFVK